MGSALDAMTAKNRKWIDFGELRIHLLLSVLFGSVVGKKFYPAWSTSKSKSFNIIWASQPPNGEDDFRSCTF